MSVGRIGKHVTTVVGTAARTGAGGSASVLGRVLSSFSTAKKAEADHEAAISKYMEHLWNTEHEAEDSMGYSHGTSWASIKESIEVDEASGKLFLTVRAASDNPHAVNVKGDDASGLYVGGAPQAQGYATSFDDGTVITVRCAKGEDPRSDEATGNQFFPPGTRVEVVKVQRRREVVELTHPGEYKGPKPLQAAVSEAIVVTSESIDRIARDVYTGGSFIDEFPHA